MKKLNKIMFLVLSMVMVCSLSACSSSEYSDEIKVINAAVGRFEDLVSGYVIMTADVHNEDGSETEFAAYYQEEYRYRIDAKQFNYTVEKTDLLTGELMERPYKVVAGSKYYTDTNEKDMDYDEDIGAFPDFLGFYLQAGLEDKYVGVVKMLDYSDNAEYDGLTGYRGWKSDSYVSQVNDDRETQGGTLVMLESYVDYWLDEAGIVVKMDYVSRDAQGDSETEILYQSYFFEMLDYNNPDIADF